MSISAVVLDLDGVLIDTESIAFRAWQQAAEEFGFKISLEVYSRIIGRTVEAARAEILEIIPDKTAIDQYMKRSDVLYFDTMEREGIRLMPGVLELLDWVEQSGLNHTVATSSDRVHAEWKIQLAGLTERIGEFVTCNDVQRGKTGTGHVSSGSETCQSARSKDALSLKMQKQESLAQALPGQFQSCCQVHWRHHRTHEVCPMASRNLV